MSRMVSGDTIRLGRRPRPVPLDPATTTALRRCLDHHDRHHRGGNPHLLVSQKSKTTAEPVSASYLKKLRAPAGVTPALYGSPGSLTWSPPWTRSWSPRPSASAAAPCCTTSPTPRRRPAHQLMNVRRYCAYLHANLCASGRVAWKSSPHDQDSRSSDQCGECIVRRAPAEVGAKGEGTVGADYADRLVRLRSVWWKRLVDVQAPYRWNLRRLRLGRTLDIGCGIGRNLQHLGEGAVGVDHNPHSVAIARTQGLRAYTVTEFRNSADGIPGSYDTLLLAHVVEHMDREGALHILRDYLKFLRPSARMVLITPQEAGYRSDKTHVRSVDFAGAADLATAVGFEVACRYSFPFPRVIGKVFRHNEFVTVAERSP